jgi:2-aminoethylphosphonate-pyruvate transaminase
LAVAKDPLLLTPGPLTTSAPTKQAMLHDWGSRDSAFIELTARLRRRLSALAEAEAEHVSVPLAGSGTFAVEAMLGTMVAREGRALVLVNGAYGRRMAEILTLAGRAYEILEGAEDQPLDTAAAAARMDADSRISDVVMVHCETTSGVLNPLEEIAEAVARRTKRLLVDAMSSFGAIPIDARRIAFDGLAASANKCLEGVPGMGFVLARRARLEACQGNCHSLGLDLHAQWQGFEKNGQWRFTPPTQVIAALDGALDQLEAEGGIGGRFARYWENCHILVSGMRRMGFETFLKDAVQAPIIVTFRMPRHSGFDFTAFYDGLARHGFLIYPGKLTGDASFRIGCIGDIRARDMENLLVAVESVLGELGIGAIAGQSG